MNYTNFPRGAPGSWDCHGIGPKVTCSVLHAAPLVLVPRFLLELYFCGFLPPAALASRVGQGAPPVGDGRWEGGCQPHHGKAHG